MQHPPPCFPEEYVLDQEAQIHQISTLVFGTAWVCLNQTEHGDNEAKKQGCELLCSHAEFPLPIPDIPYWCPQKLLGKLGKAVKMDESSTSSQLKHSFQISAPTLLCTTTTGTQVEFSEMLGGGPPSHSLGGHLGWIKGEAVETVAMGNCTATVRATHHSSSSCGLVLCSFTEQTPGKAVLLCYHKPTVYTELLRQERKTSKSNSISVKQHLECWKIKLISTH